VVAVAGTARSVAATGALDEEGAVEKEGAAAVEEVVEKWWSRWRAFLMVSMTGMVEDRGRKGGGKEVEVNLKSLPLLPSLSLSPSSHDLNKKKSNHPPSMSWDHNPDHFASSSSSHPTRSIPPPAPLPASSRNNLRGQSAHVRHLANVAVYDRDGSKAKEKERRMREEGKTDWDVLREEHRCVSHSGEGREGVVELS